MGGSAPYMYSSPQGFDFNPRAYSQATFRDSYASSIQQPKPKREGPLIDLNRHPDSWVIVASGTDANPLPENTKKKVVVTRWVQFALRILTLLGACGLFFCVICIKGTVGAEGGLIKVPPAWDVLVTAYAVYHLARPAGNRTPASSSSYHFFAMCMDGGLTPFYVFTCFFAHSNWMEAPGTEGRWRSFFPADQATNTILLTAWITSAVLGGLHILSFVLDILLALWFKKIARLPPDMNPLEDNLTSRRATKHKHKTSEATASTMSLNEKKPTNISGSTLHLNANQSQISLPRGYSIPGSNAHLVPFSHSRMHSDNSFSPHTMESARASRTHVNSQGDLYQQVASNRGSRAELNLPSTSRPNSRGRSRRRSQVDYMVNDHEPMPSPGSFVSARSAVHNRSAGTSPAPQTAITNSSAQKQQKQALLNDNWYTMDDGSDLGTPSRGNTPQPPSPYHRPHDERAYHHASQEEHEIFPHPLSSNPPIPPKSEARYKNLQTMNPESNDDNNDEEDIGRALTMGSSIYSDSASMKDAKAKYYGDLMGLRGPTHHTGHVFQANHGSDRVVSSTGVDLSDGDVSYLDDNAGMRGRQVSGKMAEEGRAVATWDRMGMRKREVSGVA